MEKKIILDEEVENIDHYSKLITSLLRKEDPLGELSDHLLKFDEPDDKLFEMFNLKKTATHIFKRTINFYHTRLEELVFNNDVDEFKKDIDGFSIFMKVILDISSCLDYFIFEIYSSKKQVKFSKEIKEFFDDLEELFKGQQKYDFGRVLNGKLEWEHEAQQLAYALYKYKLKIEDTQTITIFSKQIEKSGKIILGNLEWVSIKKGMQNISSKYINTSNNDIPQNKKDTYGFEPEEFIDDAVNVISKILKNIVKSS